MNTRKKYKMCRKSIRARVALAYLKVRGSRPPEEELNKLSELAEIFYTSIAGAISERAWQKRKNQPLLF